MIIKKSRASNDEKVLIKYIDDLKITLQGIPPANLWNYEINLTDDSGKQIITKKRSQVPREY